MERLTSFALLADTACRRVTRYQIHRIQRVFPFLDLPPELRVMIYVLCLTFDEITMFFNGVCKAILKSKAQGRMPESPSTRVVHKKSPNILLLNKQIYHEALQILYKQKLTFNHGMLDVTRLRHVIDPNVARRVQRIEISDAGHPMLKGVILTESWYGYTRLLRQLARTLSGGHSLKELVVSFSDPRLEEHMTTCFDHEPAYECGFRDQLREAIDGLRQIRGVGKVTFRGVNPKLAAQVKAVMESIPKSFMDLPREVRDMVYAETLDWSDISKSLVRGIAKWPCTRQAFPYEKQTTPTVLLLNKQIAAEALEILHKKPLVMTFPSHAKIDQEKQVPDMLDLISPATLINVSTIHITMESWQWIYNISHELVDILSKSAKLSVFHLVIKDSLKTSFLDFPGQYYPDARLHATLKKLARIRGLKEVSFEGGDIPLCYTDPLSSIMTIPYKGGNEQLPKMKSMKKTGEIVDLEEEEEADTDVDE